MLKGWNSEWLTYCPTWNCTVAQSLKPVLWSHGPCFRTVHLAIVKGFLTSLPLKSYFPLGVTHPWPSENYPQWRWEYSRSTTASTWQNTSAELFHGLRCLIWAFLNNEQVGFVTQEVRVHLCKDHRTTSWKWNCSVRTMTLVFPFLIVACMNRIIN